MLRAPSDSNQQSGNGDLSLCLYYGQSRQSALSTRVSLVGITLYGERWVLSHQCVRLRSHGKGQHQHTSKYRDQRARRRQITVAMLPHCIEFGPNGPDFLCEFTFTCYYDSPMITILPSIGLEALCCKCVNISTYVQVMYLSTELNRILMLSQFGMIIIYMYVDYLPPCITLLYEINVFSIYSQKHIHIHFLYTYIQNIYLHYLYFFYCKYYQSFVPCSVIVIYQTLPVITSYA